jgi:hypothetical protein
MTRDLDKHLITCLFGVLICAFVAPSAQGTSLFGHVRSGSAPIRAARVTLFTADLSYFRETRTSPDGSYRFEMSRRST